MSFQLAEHATYLEAARWISHLALWLLEANQSHTALASMSELGAAGGRDERLESAMRIHGNLGYPPSSPSASAAGT